MADGVDLQAIGLAEHRFGHSGGLTVGIEEELLLVEPATGKLSPVSERVLPRVRVEEGAQARHEVYAAEVELNSPVADDAGAAAGALARLRDGVREAGGTPMGVGIHPTGSFGDAPLVGLERYQRVGGSMRGLVGRTPDSALHVHVGMPDPETALRAFNALRAYLPLLQGLAANSPYWHGLDSGFASARSILVRSFPRSGVPRAFSDFTAYAMAVAQVVAAGELEDYTFVWWDLRVHPRHGTVEVRGMDAQSSLVTVAGLAALVHGLAAHAIEHAPGCSPPQEALAESSFRASRDGLEATVLHDNAMVPLRELASDALERARPYVREQGADGALEGVERVLREGGGADRQRRAFRRGGMSAVLDGLMSESAAPVGF